ncbi:unnamed protein product, partial [Polarella glacialis]
MATAEGRFWRGFDYRSRLPWSILAAQGAALCLSHSAAAAASQRPPLVSDEASDFGGGRPDVERGHGKSMQEALAGRASPVAELSESPSWEVFYEQYMRKNIPVVIRKHMVDQPGYKLWTDDYLRSNWGSREISVEMKKIEERGGPSREMSLAKLLDEMYKPDRSDQLYAVIDFDTDAKALRDFKMPAPLNCKEIAPQSLTLWMSSGGTSSVLHQDDADNFLMLLAGKKRVMLVHQDQAHNIYAHTAKSGGTSSVHQGSVDLEAFPRFADVPWLSAELGPGDTLFIPHSYWHQVESEGRNLAVNLWYGHRGDWAWWPVGNQKIYSPMHFGSDGFPKFDDLRNMSAATLPCKPLAPGADLSQ